MIMAEKNKKKDETPEEEIAQEAGSEIVGSTSEEAPEETAGDNIAAEVISEEKPAEVKVETEPRKISAQEKVSAITDTFLKTDIPDFRPGDTVKVHVKIIEGNKERIQVFEGIVTAMKHGGVDTTFTVRKTSWGVGVERTFFAHSKKLDRIEVARRGQVRRAKLYYLRQRAGKSARIKEKRMAAK
jgi:large subunit ribosomal protein L19